MKLKLFLLALVIFNLSQPIASAAKRIISPELTPGTIVVTPENLDQVLFRTSTDIAREMNNVLRARDSVELARANLIPSLNLNLGLVVANPPQFLLSSVSCLVPFLFPSKWFDLAAARQAASAEVSALEITKLNAFAAAYAVLSQYSSYQQILAVLNEQHSRLEEYVRGLNEQFTFGVITPADLDRGRLELNRMQLDTSKIVESMETSKASLRKMLGLNIEQQFELQFGEETASQLEAVRPTQLVINGLYNRAPERRQLELLLEAAENQIHSAEWAFLAGCSGAQGSFAPTSGGAFTQSTAIAISIGYGNFASVSLSKRNRDDIMIRQTELMLELGRVLESTQRSIESLKLRIEKANESIQTSEKLLAEQTELAELGRASVKDILDAFNNIARSKIELITAKASIDGHRITLKRLGLEGKFLRVLIKSRRDLETNIVLRRGD